MKYLFWLIVGLCLWWAWKRSLQQRSRPPAPPAENAPQDMVACAHCGVHLPLGEAVSGTRGHYCSTAHRSAASDRNPA